MMHALRVSPVPSSLKFGSNSDIVEINIGNYLEDSTRLLLSYVYYYESYIS